MPLIKAVDDCLNLKRDDGGIGTQISMALLERDNLSSVECQNLYLNLEEVRRSTQTARLSSAEYEVFLRRHGKSLADDFKSEMDSSAVLNSAGLGILMTRLSYRLARLKAKVNQLHEPESAYTRIAGVLRDCRSHIEVAAEAHNKRVSAVMPDKAWSNEAMDFVRNSASILAITYPG